jgi:hypothetical protein
MMEIVPNIHTLDKCWIWKMVDMEGLMKIVPFLLDVYQ